MRAKLIKEDESLEVFRWSSYGFYLKRRAERPVWLRVDRLFGEKRIPKDSAAGRREFRLQMERRRREEETMDHSQLRRGWCLGGEEFRKELLLAAFEGVGPHHYGADRQESGQEKAERMVIDGLKKLKWAETELRKRRKGDPGKVRLARELREETTMSLKWIAARLKMGSWTYVSNLLRSEFSPKQLFKK